MEIRRNWFAATVLATVALCGFTTSRVMAAGPQDSSPASSITEFEVQPQMAEVVQHLPMPATAEPVATPRGVVTTCTVPPCENTIYAPGGGTGGGFVFGNNNGDRVDDDVYLTGTARFVCSMNLILGGINNSGILAPVTVSVFTGNTSPVCPESPESQLLFSATQDITLSNPPQVVTFFFDPPVYVNEDFVWVGMSTPPPTNDAFWSIGGYPTVGHSLDLFVVEDLSDPEGEICNGNFFFFGGSPYSAFSVQINATDGDPGACCNRDVNTGGMGTCTDAVARSTCIVNTVNVFKPGACADFGTDPSCNLCISDAVCMAGATAEGEAVCSSGYHDLFNQGCLESPFAFTSISCGQAICATSGNYAPFCNTVSDCVPGQSCNSNACTGPAVARDNDWYLLTLTQLTEITATVEGRLPMQISLMNNGGAAPSATCPTAAFAFLEFANSTRSCEPISITRCLPPGTWILRVRPDVLAGIPCNTKYRISVSCTTCNLPNGACCDSSMAGCSERPEIGCAGAGGFYLGDGTTCAVEGLTCPGVPPNDTCGNKTLITGVMASVTYNSSLATTDDLAAHPGADIPADCPIGELAAPNAQIVADVFYNYRIPTNFNGTAVTAGDLVISTAGANFDTWVVIYGQPNAVNNCGIGLCGAPQATCNDDVLASDSMALKFNSLSYLTLPIESGSAQFFDPGDCIKVRIGGAGTAPAGRGNGVFNVDFIPRSSPFSLQTGRCCFANGTCSITLDEGTCIGMGGFPRPVADFNEGDPAISEQVAGCKTDPCPGPGDSCYTALDFNAMVGTSGTLTRSISDVLYVKYELPASGAVVIDTCGTTGFNTILAIYSTIENSPGAGERYGDCDLGSLILLNDNCTNTESSADGALGAAACYGGLNSTSNSCLCLPIGGGPGLSPGSIIYIALGGTGGFNNDFFYGDSPREVFDPVTNATGAPAPIMLTVTTTAACFTCPTSCPGGSLQEGNDVICADTSDPNPQDLHNGGCNATPPSFNGPDIDCSGGPVVICGRAGNFEQPFPCDNPIDCPNGEPCTGSGGSCIGTARFVNRDEDWFRMTVTQPSTIRWRVLSSSFAAELGILADQGGDCTDLFLFAADSVDFACDPPAGTPSTLEVTAAVCAGTYYLRIRPSVFGGLGNTDCSSEYSVEASCQPFNQLTTCCPGDLNADGKVNGRDIQKWISVLFTPPTVFDDFLGCFAPNFCRGDINGDGSIALTDLPAFVNLLVTSNKPVCTLAPTCSDPSTTQAPFDSIGASRSDLDVSGSGRAADCFVPLETGTITNICWWGTYIQVAGDDCVAADPDCFHVQFYQTTANRCPGAAIGGAQHIPTATNLTRVTTGGGIILPAAVATEFFYTATLVTPVAVTAGVPMWLEITNNTPVNDCQWFWEQSPQGDTRHAVTSLPASNDLPSNYTACTAANVQQRDLAFSLNVRIAKDGCGKPTGRCCYDAPPLGVLDCQVTAEDVCVAVLNGEWSENGTCSPVNLACTVGRCCYLDQALATQCVSTIQATCEQALDGIWASGASCPCPTGRCCIQGNCTSMVTEVACRQQDGIWTAGADCSQQCPTGICNNVSRCQLPHLINGLQQGGYVTDLDNAAKVADDFRTINTAGGNFINQVCFRGFHRTGTQDCSPLVQTENFVITYYANGGNNLPNTAAIVGGPFMVTPLKSVALDTLGNPEGVLGGGVQYQYEVNHAAVNLTANACFWIEIQQVNADPSCVFLWSTSNEGGNQRSAITKTSGGDAFTYQLLDRDLSWCLGPMNLNSAGCTFPAPPIPANDQCANATNIGVGVQGPIAGTTIGASADPGSNAGCSAAFNARDVYYRWTQGPVARETIFQLCTINTTFDATISVHKTTSGAMGCPATSASDSQIAVNGGCNADGCPTGLGTNQLFFQGRQPRLRVTPAQAPTLLPANTQFLIRITGETKGGPSNNTPDGVFTLSVEQP